MRTNPQGQPQPVLTPGSVPAGNRTRPIGNSPMPAGNGWQVLTPDSSRSVNHAHGLRNNIPPTHPFPAQQNFQVQSTTWHITSETVLTPSTNQVGQRTLNPSHPAPAPTGFVPTQGYVGNRLPSAPTPGFVPPTEVDASYRVRPGQRG